MPSLGTNRNCESIACGSFGLTRNLIEVSRKNKDKWLMAVATHANFRQSADLGSVENLFTETVVPKHFWKLLLASRKLVCFRISGKYDKM